MIFAIYYWLLILWWQDHGQVLLEGCRFKHNHSCYETLERQMQPTNPGIVLELQGGGGDHTTDSKRTNRLDQKIESRMEGHEHGSVSVWMCCNFWVVNFFVLWTRRPRLHKDHKERTISSPVESPHPGYWAQGSEHVGKERNITQIQEGPSLIAGVTEHIFATPRSY